MVAGIAGAGNDGVGAGGASNIAANGADAGVAGSDPDTVVPRGAGPCDIYASGNTPCVAAYSMVRALSSTYDGPLYQVRRGAPNPTQNTGVGGETQDIGLLPNGFADAAAQVAFCGEQSCTVSTLYDQSGRGNHVTVAKRGRVDGGQFGDDDDFESTAGAGPLSVGGNEVFSLYMEARQGYRQTFAGNGMPLGQAPQGVYMLADGTRAGTACCWDFGNVTTDPTEYATMNTLFFGTAFWGRGAGAGPWFMADFEAGVWAGGSNPGEPGWGALNDPAPINPNNPSLRVRFALGFLKTSTTYALRMADVDSATDATTAYEGPLPKPMDNRGAVVLGVGGDNSNNSFGTFYEGAIVSGYPSNDVERAVLQNIQSAGYGR
jgi:non-reducing end alpha-L-arabinofuranosidase